VLLMGWKESPPIFTSATETITTLVNVAILEGEVQQAHRIEEVTETASDVTTSQTQLQPRSDPASGNMFTSIGLSASGTFYVDDFIGLVQVSASRRRSMKRALLYSLDKVFRGLGSTYGPFRQESASIKKLLKGDATLATRKVVLRWVRKPPPRRSNFRPVVWSDCTPFWPAPHRPNGEPRTRNDSRRSVSSGPCHWPFQERVGSSAPYRRPFITNSTMAHMRGWAAMFMLSCNIFAGWRRS
jgi:hypothetical protein